MNLMLAVILIGNLTTTSYRSIPSQTDSSPYYTSTGEHVHPHGVAVSRDLLSCYGGPIDYGDFIYIDQIGFKVVNDTMNERFTNRIDIWVSTKEEEKQFDKRFGHKKLKIWLIRKKQSEKERDVKRSVKGKVRKIS